MHRLLITGAAGNLGRHLRETLRGFAPVVRLSDIAPMAPARDGEEVIQADLADLAAVERIADGVDAVLHFGGIAQEAPWDAILPSNIVGCYNMWEAARRAGVKRIVHASSNHAIGMYPRTQVIDTGVMHRPDGYYGLAKAFAEDLARMYWDKHGIEAACLRIGSCFPEPTGERMLATWLSYDDMARLCRACLEAPVLEFTVVYGMSANDRLLWDNGKAAFLGYRPQDSAAPFAEKILAAGPAPDPRDPAVRFHGGAFSAQDYTRKD